jgi:glycosyltransferase involved in cell wall biosynthesis
MKVLYIVPAYPPFVSGSARLAHTTVEFLKERGHNVTVLTTNALNPTDYWLKDRHRALSSPDKLSKATVIRWPVKYLPFSKLSFKLIRDLTLLLGCHSRYAYLSAALGHFYPWLPGFRAEAIKRASQSDIVHVMDISYDAAWLSGIHAAKQTQTPLIGQPLIHGGLGSRTLQHYTMSHQLLGLCQCDTIFAMTDWELGLLEQLGIDVSNTHVIGACIDVTQYGTGDQHSFLHRWKIQKPVIGFLGTVTRDKGALDLVKAASTLWDQGLRFSLVIAGPSADLALPENKPWLHALGTLSESDKHGLLAALDVLALPSRVDSFGIVFLEAWAYRKPVIGAQVGGITSVIDDNINGMLIPFGEPDTLASSIHKLLTDKRLAKKLGQAGFRKVMENYRCTHLLSRIEKLYENCARRSQVPSHKSWRN